MGKLDQFVDVTGTMAPTEVNAENIKNIINELNRNTDLLDSLNNSLKIIARGSKTFSWNGTATQQVLVIPVNANVAFVPLVFFSSSLSPSVLNSTPYLSINISTGSLLIDIHTNTNTNELDIAVNLWANGSAQTFTFYYFIIQQPAQVI